MLHVGRITIHEATAASDGEVRGKEENKEQWKIGIAEPDVSIFDISVAIAELQSWSTLAAVCVRSASVGSSLTLTETSPRRPNQTGAAPTIS